MEGAVLLVVVLARRYASEGRCAASASTHDCLLVWRTRKFYIVGQTKHEASALCPTRQRNPEQEKLGKQKQNYQLAAHVVLVVVVVAAFIEKWDKLGLASPT
ncbi:unnamed protein product [Polarella glacialis]|uniref:Uncharacterized protein n=1 Tax=Polarella glacialis TaxID=89957 RepID=A0A813DTU0_POLGL|nr:unnamed protein product [Polarella glacialis]CAE8588848.1 unnamed protein product [Polarella glacialis]